MEVPQATNIITSLPHEHIHHQNQTFAIPHGDTLPPEVDSNPDQPKESIMLSLRVCEECQASLMGAFNHCLSQHGDMPSISSIQEIDEIKDGLLTSEQPYFDIVQDPTVFKTAVFDSGSERVAKDRWVFSEKKRAQQKLEHFSAQAAQMIKVKGLGVEKGKSFSGALYKKMLDYKDKEIQQLREQLYEKNLAEDFESKNVDRLRHALSKAVKYYTFAEEWQKTESDRLQKDVRFLKAELSSMMAFLINAEEEKRKLRIQIEEVNNIVKVRDVKIIDMQHVEEQLRVKLHESFKEFIAMNETMTQLKKEAVRGTEAAESRNDMLQRNLDKLASDFESTTRDLAAANLKIRELEFEMEELVQQFNFVGEGKKKSEELNVRITNDLSMTTQELKDTKEELEQTILQKSKLEADLRASEEQSAAVKSALEFRIESLTAELTTALSLKSDLEISTRQMRTENEKLNLTLKSVSKSKENVEASLKASTTKSEKDVAARDARIKELENARVEDAKQIKKLQEQKEQMRSQVTELQNSLDREVSNFNVLSFETAQTKRQTEDKISNLEDQIEKVTTAKNNLSNEKKQLSEKLKSVRTELKEREDELEYYRNAYKKQGDEGLANDIRLRTQVASLEISLESLKDDHAKLTVKYQDSENLAAQTKSKLESTSERLAEFEQKHTDNTARIAQLESKNELLINEHSQAVQARVAMKIHLDSVLIKVEELNTTLKNAESEYSATLKDRENKIVKLSNDLRSTQDESKKWSELSIQLKALVERLDVDLSVTKTSLAMETLTRETLETRLYDTTQSLNNEKKLRQEFERMNSRIGRIDELKTLERLAILKMRDYKLQEIDKGLADQLGHLNTVVRLLPKDLDFGETDAKPIPLFNVKEKKEKKGGDAGGKSSKEELRAQNESRKS